MSRGSAFARVIGLTKSLSPLVFDRGAQPAANDGDEPAPPAAADGTATDFGDSPAAAIAAFPLAQEVGDVPDGPSAYVDAGVVAMAAMAQVTVVAAVPAADERPPVPQPGAALPATDDALRQTITAEAISSIEADIASLLASLDREDMAGDAELLAMGPIETEDEAQMGTLLGELDRMWQTDPAVAVNRLL